MCYYKTTMKTQVGYSVTFFHIFVTGFNPIQDWCAQKASPPSVPVLTSTNVQLSP